MTHLNVAVIDDGINEAIYAIGTLLHNIEINRDLSIQQRRLSDPEASSHGTICAAIIKKYAPTIALSSVRILNRDCRGLPSQLVTAINWCLKNEVHVINLSLGSIHPADYQAIKKVINQAYNQGIIIVSACNNRNIYTYPASFSTVIGVKRDLTLSEGEFRFHDYPFDGIEITACGCHTLITSNGMPEYIHQANSYAAPLITAQVCNLMQSSGTKLSLEEIKFGLYKKAVNCSKFYDPYLTRTIDWVQKSQFIYLEPAGYAVEHCLPTDTTNKLKIKCEDVEDGVVKTIDFLIENKSNILDKDTITVLSPTEQRCLGLDNLYEYCCTIKSNLIFLDNCDAPPELRETNRGVKFWHPTMYHHFYQINYNNPIDKNHDDQTPVVIVYNFSHKSIVPFLHCLQCCFTKDGYRSIGVTDAVEGICYNLELLPKNLNNMFKYGSNSFLTPYIATHHPDIVILGVTLCGDKSLLAGIDEHVRPDIRVIVSDDSTAYNHIQFAKNEFTNSLLDKSSLINLELHQDFNTFDHWTLKQIYSDILERFKNDY